MRETPTGSHDSWRKLYSVCGDANQKAAATRAKLNSRRTLLRRLEQKWKSITDTRSGDDEGDDDHHHRDNSNILAVHGVLYDVRSMCRIVRTASRQTECAGLRAQWMFLRGCGLGDFAHCTDENPVAAHLLIPIAFYYGYSRLIWT